MPNPVVHFEVNGTDAAKLQGFYGDLFGWTINPIPNMEFYALVEKEDEGIAGGIGAPPPDMDPPGHGVTFYVQVDDLQAALDKAENLGGKAVNPPMEVPGTDIHLAHFADPEGHLIGLVKGM